MSAKKRTVPILKEEVESEAPGGSVLRYTVIADDVPAKRMRTQEDEIVNVSTWQTCSLCGSKVSDLATHIVDDHTELQDLDRVDGRAKAVTVKSPNPVRYKGPFRQVKPVLRYPCDACKTVTKTSDQLKKHMILVHNGHKNTSWMFCGDCEYATRVEDELINHVKIHQIFNILKEDFIKAEIPEIPGDSDFSETPIECGDCSFTTHHENEMFTHVKEHMGKHDKYGPVNEEEKKKLEKMEKKGKTKAELQEHKMFTIHNKKGGTVTIKHNPLKPKKVF
ncbi:zinc finger protein 639 [Eurytemora carolleeae]|uniref:zinc finger protein 639 n=1 Tax=Eurytemora carolleeae TaxID=1294199 RepID=UPI000C78925A|nr:zinc finger protein 639 [Eurytemora carolleeae]|eukprot:XP_023342625.1 zinc finger protein 639-like [Eurytemora affinis]